MLLIFFLPDAPAGVSLVSNHNVPVIEGIDCLELTCTVGEDGNPPTDSYYWKYPRSSDWVSSTDNIAHKSARTLFTFFGQSV